MAAEDYRWTTVLLRQLCVHRDGIITGPFGSQLHADEYVHEGIPSVMPQDIGDNVVKSDSIARVSAVDAQRLARFRMVTGDIVMGRRGDIGRRALVRAEEDGWLCGTGSLRIRPSRESVDSEFLSYYLGLPSVVEWLRQRAVGATLPNLNTSIVGSIPVRLPPLSEQRSIGRILGALDDKIELNRRMNQTLEEICRALFKFWFVDFGPLHAKAEGRWKRGESLPGMPADMWDLWPSEFEDSEIGEIPKGWDVSPTSSTVEVNPERQLARGHDALYVDMGGLPTSSARVTGWVERQFASGSRFRNGDTLVARITPCLENGKTGYVDFLKEGQVGWGSTEFLVLSTKPPLPPQFAYCLARTEDFRSHLIQNMSGTSGRQRAPADCLDSFLFAVPSYEITRRFGTAVGPWFESMKSNDAESSTLGRIRDALLPKLLSGEIRVPADGGD